MPLRCDLRVLLVLYYPAWFLAVVVAESISFASPDFTFSPLSVVLPFVFFLAPIFLVGLRLLWISAHGNHDSADHPVLRSPGTPNGGASPDRSNAGDISRRDERNVRIGNPSESNLNLPLKYSYAVIQSATDNFHHNNKLGEGGQAEVFKGDLPNHGAVAVKRFKHVPAPQQQSGDDFRKEVLILGRLYHNNVVRLCGYCIDGTERLLVYEFLPKGSLYDRLFKPESPRWILDWEQRLAIAKDAARGLCYLHHECPVDILHNDVKPHNILLDEELRAKVADFGLAKLIRKDQSRSPAGGTLGYLPPEKSTFQITQKADVYSFGIVLLQMVTGREVGWNATDTLVPGHSLRDAVTILMTTDRKTELLDHRLAANSKGRAVALEMAEVGIKCVKYNPEDRPTMDEVLKLLEGISTGDATISPSAQ